MTSKSGKQHHTNIIKPKFHVELVSAARLRIHISSLAFLDSSMTKIKLTTNICWSNVHVADN